MTNEQLIKLLSAYPGDAIVVGEWDNGWSHIEDVKCQAVNHGTDAISVISLDVKEHGTFETRLIESGKRQPKSF